MFQLDAGYLDEIAQYIMQNRGSGRLALESTSPAHPAPIFSSSRTPAETCGIVFPDRTPCRYRQLNAAGVRRKLEEFSAQLGQSFSSLSAADFATLDALLTVFAPPSLHSSRSPAPPRPRSRSATPGRRCCAGCSPGRSPPVSPFSTFGKTRCCAPAACGSSPKRPASTCSRCVAASGSPFPRLLECRLPEASPALLAVFLRLLANLCAVSRSDRLAAQLPELLAFCKAVQLLENRMVAQALSSFLLNASQCCLDWQRGKPASEESTGVSSAIVTVGCDLVDRCGDEVALERAIGAICNMLILNPFVGVGRGFYEELPRCG